MTRKDLPDPRLLLILAFILMATVFGSLYGIWHQGREMTAILVTLGLAVSLLPILVRVLPPLARDARSGERHPQDGITIVALILYVAIVFALLILVNT